MLTDAANSLYIYPITRDLGFAPNPFHGLCTLATCKPKIRKGAKIGDWIMGVGGATCGTARGRCIFLMRVTEKIGFDTYWADPRFLRKRSIRNGSLKMLVGDNIYHKNELGGWVQEDSHHSNSDGSPNENNLTRDTGRTDQVLISEYFLYFGSAAFAVDLDAVGYGKTRVRDYCRYPFAISPAAVELVEIIISHNQGAINQVFDDPVHFESAHTRVDQQSGRFS